MTDINIVRRRPAVLPWLVGLGLVLLLTALWLSWGRNAGDVAFSATEPGGVPTPGTTPAPDGVPAEVSAYGSFVESSAAPTPGLSHDYAATGITRLTAALRAVAGPDATGDPLSQRFVTFEESAGRLRADPNSLDHAHIVRSVFIDAVNVMSSLAQARSSDSTALTNRVDDLRRLAESIETNRPLLDQQQRVTQFFEQSAATLTLLAQP